VGISRPGCGLGEGLGAGIVDRLRGVGGGAGGLRKAKGLEVEAKMLASAASLKLNTTGSSESTA
jgi:hypothetical protein